MVAAVLVVQLLALLDAFAERVKARLVGIDEGWLAAAATFSLKSKSQLEQSAAFKSLLSNRESIECRELLTRNARLALIDFILQEMKFSGQLFLLDVHIP